MRRRTDSTAQTLRRIWARLQPGRMLRPQHLVGLFVAFWVFGTIDAVVHVASFVAYPFLARVLLGALMGPAGTIWRSLKASDILVDTAEAPNMAWLVIVIWTPMLLALALPLAANATLALVEARRKHDLTRLGYPFHAPGGGRFRRRRKSNKKRRKK